MTGAAADGIDRAGLDQQYNARAGVASFDAAYAKYAAISANAQAEHEPIAGIIYDPVSRETPDFYIRPHPGVPQTRS